MTLKQSSAVRIQALVSTEGNLFGCSSKPWHLVKSLASLSGRPLVNFQTAPSPYVERHPKKILQTFKHHDFANPTANITPTQCQACKKTKNPNEQFFYKPCNNYRFTKFTNDSTSPTLFSIHRP